LGHIPHSGWNSVPSRDSPGAGEGGSQGLDGQLGRVPRGRRQPSQRGGHRGGVDAEGVGRPQLADQLGQLLDPNLLQDTGLTMRHLCNNQSGIRDYWALTVLWGAKPEGHFSVVDHGPKMLARLKSFHFQPGT
jgi:hypothetical protein